MATICDNVDMTKIKQTDVIIHPKLLKGEYPQEEFKATNSILSNVLTPQLFNELKDLKTSNGITLNDIINTGVKNPTSQLGIHAGDIESYTVFKKLFDPCILLQHNLKDNFTQPNEKMDINKIKGSFNTKHLIRSTRIRVARNISGFNLAPGQKNVSEKLEIEQLMIKVFNTLDNDLSGKYYSLDTMNEKDRIELIKNHFLFRGNDPKQTDSGYHKWFPKGRGIYLNNNKTFLIWLNEGDHLRIISMENSSNVRSVYDRLSTAVNKIEESLIKITNGKHRYMHNNKLGYISCCPSNLGTGLRGGVHIKLDRLSKLGVEKLSQIGLKFGIQARGVHGEFTQSKGGYVDLSNFHRLGYSENELVQNMINGVNQFIQMENENKL